MKSQIKSTAVSKKPPDTEFLAEIAEQLRNGITRRKELATRQGKRFTNVQAAEELDVSRASLQFYLAAKHMPSSDVLRRAMEIWGIELTYRQRKLTVVDLSPPPNRKRTLRPQAVQLGLWDSLKKLNNNDLTIRVIKKSQKAISLQVDVTFIA